MAATDTLMKKHIVMTKGTGIEKAALIRLP